MQTQNFKHCFKVLRRLLLLNFWCRVRIKHLLQHFIFYSFWINFESKVCSIITVSTYVFCLFQIVDLIIDLINVLALFFLHMFIQRLLYIKILDITEKVREYYQLTMVIWSYFDLNTCVTDPFFISFFTLNQNFNTIVFLKFMVQNLSQTVIWSIITVSL